MRPGPPAAGERTGRAASGEYAHVLHIPITGSARLSVCLRGGGAQLGLVDVAAAAASATTAFGARGAGGARCVRERARASENLVFYMGNYIVFSVRSCVLEV